MTSGVQKQRIAVHGFMGAGKTSVGRELSRALDVPFFDLDEVLEARFGPIPDQFQTEGEEVFREREREVLVELCSIPGPLVLSLGGGTLVHEASRNLVFSGFWVVTLHAPLGLCEARASSSTRPLKGRMGELYRLRSAIYEVGHWHQDASANLEEVCHQVLRGYRAAPPVRVHSQAAAYDVVIEEGFQGLRQLVGDRAHVVSDKTVWKLWGQELTKHLHGVQLEVSLIEPGERSKSVASWVKLVDDILEGEPSRSTPVIAFGGGVVGDLAGFAASTVKRGLPVVQVPTTTLAMIDSSVGGKTAINHRLGKNLVGAFHPPSSVYIALQCLQTLPQVQFRSGVAEAIKMAWCLDQNFFNRLQNTPVKIDEIIRHSVLMKAGIVSVDEQDRGPREVLNAGHTIGHALEQVMGLARPHGEAVAIGLVAEARISVALNLASEESIQQIKAVLQKFSLPTEMPAVSLLELTEAMKMDKKVRDGLISWIVVSRPGHSRRVQIPLAVVATHLESLV